MPLTDLQKRIFRAIAQNRDPEDFVAGGTPINRAGPRVSEDIDLFSERAERVAAVARIDTASLAAAGFVVTALRELPGLVAANVSDEIESTKLEWVADSDFRFFPALPDDDFGYVLSIPDLAINKLMAAVGRREPRDVVDLLTLHDNYLPLGAIAWAAVVVAPGFTPEGLLAELRRSSRYVQADYSQVWADQPIDASVVARRIGAAIGEAEDFVRRMPTEKCGFLFLEGGRPVQPDPDQIALLVEHGPTRKGHWPTGPGIMADMLSKLAPK